MCLNIKWPYKGSTINKTTQISLWHQYAFFSNKNIAASVAFPNVERTRQRAKEKAQSGNKGVYQIQRKYSSIQAFHNHIKKYPDILEMKNGDDIDKISAYLLESSSQSHHVILYDEKLVHDFNDNNDMFIDGTFRICPDVKGVKQVLTIMCKKYNVVSNIFSLQSFYTFILLG